MWLYCWHPGGCDSGAAGAGARLRLQEGACQLLHLQDVRVSPAVLSRV